MRRVKLKNPFRTRQIDERLIREHLALQRTKLANERTLLSYIKASLYLLIGGLTVVQIKKYDHIQWVGYLALVFCVAFIVVGISRYIHLERKMSNLLRENEKIEDKNASSQNS